MLKIIGESQVSIPDEVFKIFYALKRSRKFVLAVKISNSMEDKNTNIVDTEFSNIKFLERNSGLKFPDELFDKENENLCSFIDCHR